MELIDIAVSLFAFAGMALVLIMFAAEGHVPAPARQRRRREPSAPPADIDDQEPAGIDPTPAAPMRYVDTETGEILETPPGGTRP